MTREGVSSFISEKNILMNIRMLTTDDVEAYKALKIYAYQESPFAFSDSYEDMLRRTDEEFESELKTQGEAPEKFVLGAVQNENDLVGFVLFKRDQRSKARHKSMIHVMYVRREYRGTGIGRELITDVVLRAQQMRGLEQIHLWVLHVDISATLFYKKCGFISQGPRVQKDLVVQGRSVDAEYMVMYL